MEFCESNGFVYNYHISIGNTFEIFKVCQQNIFPVMLLLYCLLVL